MKCPNCKNHLHGVTYEGITIETCESCGGEWLDGGELATINKVRDVRFNDEEKKAVAAATPITGVKLRDVDRDLLCPKCDGVTDPVNYGGDTGIVIDRCPGCGGIWLDAHEMEKIQMLVEHWENGLPDDLKKHSARLKRVGVEIEERTRFNLAGIPFMNALVNRVIDVFE